MEYLASVYEPVSRVWPGSKEGYEWKSATSATVPASLEKKMLGMKIYSSAISDEPHSRSFCRGGTVNPLFGLTILKMGLLLK